MTCYLIQFDINLNYGYDIHKNLDHITRTFKYTYKSPQLCTKIQEHQHITPIFKYTHKSPQFCAKIQKHQYSVKYIRIHKKTKYIRKKKKQTKSHLPCQIFFSFPNNTKRTCKCLGYVKDNKVLSFKCATKIPKNKTISQNYYQPLNSHVTKLSSRKNY